MDAKVKDELDKIVDTLVATGIVSKIILFGSYARGDETSDSDIDLCVLTTEKSKHPIDVMKDLRLEISNIQTMPLDLFALEQEGFYSHAKRPTSFHHHILNKGIVLYE